jgi:hypothetical protein
VQRYNIQSFFAQEVGRFRSNHLRDLSQCLLGNKTTTVNSALTTTIVGHLKNILTVLVGLAVFGGIMTLPLTLGLCINIGGGLLFSYVKYQANKR